MVELKKNNNNKKSPQKIIRIAPLFCQSWLTMFQSQEFNFFSGRHLGEQNLKVIIVYCNLIKPPALYIQSIVINISIPLLIQILCEFLALAALV